MEQKMALSQMDFEKARQGKIADEKKRRAGSAEGHNGIPVLQTRTPDTYESILGSDAALAEFLEWFWLVVACLVCAAVGGMAAYAAYASWEVGRLEAASQSRGFERANHSRGPLVPRSRKAAAQAAAKTAAQAAAQAAAQSAVTRPPVAAGRGVAAAGSAGRPPVVAPGQGVAAAVGRGEKAPKEKRKKEKVQAVTTHAVTPVVTQAVTQVITQAVTKVVTPEVAEAEAKAVEARAAEARAATREAAARVAASVTHKPTVAIVVTVTPKYGAMADHG